MFPLRIVAALLALGGAVCFAQDTDFRKNLAPYVPMPATIVERVLEAAVIRPGETVYDLGCGDGRILIAAAEKFKARAVGIEISAKLVKAATESVRKLGLQSRVQIIQDDILNVDLSPADVVTIYLLTKSNERLRPHFERDLKPGARVVSYEFEVRGWKPNHIEKVESYRRSHYIYVYEMPPQKP
jgi:ubiquinone/menaquinone biosynthesis C-methylase UbiE